jgi:peptidoglycan/LPS O-acetylase OafA/YrhL
MTRVGWFECSNPLVTRLHENVVWGLRSNFVDVPTDCPQRDERLGWTGDIQVFAPTAAFIYDVSGMLSSWMADLAAEQEQRNWVPLWVPYFALEATADGPSGQPAVHGGLVDRFRVLADLTFPIYVLHFPLLILWRVLFGLRVEDHGQYALALTSVLFVAAILGLALERQRPRWGRAFGRLFAWGERLRHGLRPRAT